MHKLKGECQWVIIDSGIPVETCSACGKKRDVVSVLSWNTVCLQGQPHPQKAGENKLVCPKCSRPYVTTGKTCPKDWLNEEDNFIRDLNS